MLPEDRLLYACLTVRFADADCRAVMAIGREQAVDWRRVYTTAVDHGVAPLVWHNLQQCRIEFHKLCPRVHGAAAAGPDIR